MMIGSHAAYQLKRSSKNGYQNQRLTPALIALKLLLNSPLKLSGRIDNGDFDAGSHKTECVSFRGYLSCKPVSRKYEPVHGVSNPVGDNCAETGKPISAVSMTSACVCNLVDT